MTIDEAIKRLELLKKGSFNDPFGYLHDSIKLGIEALKRIKESRFLKCQVASDKLPGETEE